MSPFENEHEIALGIIASDKSALKALYSQYFLSIQKFLCHRSRNLTLAEDLAQDTFFKLWENRDKINPEKSLKNYLYQIANNLFIDHIRRVKIERQYTDYQAFTSDFEQHPEIDIAVQIAIDKLPEKLKVVFVLSRAEGFSYKEIAQTLNVSVKTIEYRIYTALEFLKKELKD